MDCESFINFILLETIDGNQLIALQKSNPAVFSDIMRKITTGYKMFAGLTPPPPEKKLEFLIKLNIEENTEKGQKFLELAEVLSSSGLNKTVFKDRQTLKHAIDIYLTSHNLLLKPQEVQVFL
jgi:hypothetical protein